MQDTIHQKNPVGSDTVKHIQDSVSGQQRILQDTSSVQHKILTIKKEAGFIADTTASGRQTWVPDVTYNNPAIEIFQPDSVSLKGFPFSFVEMGRKLGEESNTALVRHLKEGSEIPKREYESDWILPVCLISAFLYAVLRATSAGVFRGLLRFISFRGISDTGSRNTGELFRWQSTLLNSASFLNLSIFVYLATIKYDLQMAGVHGILVWLICLSIIITATTIRHFICIITGKASGEDEVFREYLVGVYEAYRIAGLISFLIILLILYTAFLPVTILFYSGFCLIGLLYLVRVLRLFLIFINRHVSIFYLILYLCALEILPVLILVKYVTGLV